MGTKYLRDMRQVEVFVVKLCGRTELSDVPLKVKVTLEQDMETRGE